MAQERLGFQFIRKMGGGHVPAQTFRWAGVNSVNIGDVVILDNGLANTLFEETAANILGVVVGKQVSATNDWGNSLGKGVSLSGMTTPNLNKRAVSASSAEYVRVIVDRDAYFLASVNKAMGEANVGETTNIYWAGVDPTAANVGRSGMYLLGSQMGSSNLGAFKIVAIPKGVDRHANAVIVRRNRSCFDSHSTPTGM